MVDLSRSFDINCVIASLTWSYFNQSLFTCKLQWIRDEWEILPRKVLWYNLGRNYASRQLEYIHAVQISNDVENVTAGFDHFFPELKLFKANENEEMVIKKAIFKGLAKLEVLYLQNKGIRTFEEGVFRDLKLLRN